MQSPSFKIDLKKKKKGNLLNHLTQGGVMTIKYAEPIGEKHQDTGA